MVKVRVRPETGRLYLDLSFAGKRCKELTLLKDEPSARARVEKLAARINADIATNTFDYCRYFPAGKNRSLFSATTSEIVSSRGTASRSESASLPTLADFASIWLREKRPDWRQNTRDWIENILAVHLLPAFGTWRVDQIKRQHILEFRAKLAERKFKNGKAISARTVNAVMRNLKAILAEAAVRYGFPNPGERIKRLKVPRKEINPFSLDEMHLILKTIRKDYHSYLTVAFFTGMRPGEINGLQWKCVDFEKGEICVRETYTAGKPGDTKTEGSQREIAMCGPVRAALLAQREVTGKLGGYVFCGMRGNPIHDRAFRRWVWDPIIRHLGLKKRTPYQTRHTCATLWLASGENPEWVARQLGHTTTEMLFRVYSRFIPRSERAHV